MLLDDEAVPGSAHSSGSRSAGSWLKGTWGCRCSWYPEVSPACCDMVVWFFVEPNLSISECVAPAGIPHPSSCLF